MKPWTRYGFLGQAQIYAMLEGVIFYPFGIFQTLVPRFVGDEQFTARIFQIFDQVNCMFNPFSLYNACGLQDGFMVLVQPEGFKEIFVIPVIDGLRIAEIEHVGNDGCLNAPATDQVKTRHGINNDVLDAGRSGWKEIVQIISDSIYSQTISFPEKIMMMGDGGNLKF
jgi:hypothetical protein